MPERYISLIPDAKESEHHACGENRARRAFGEQKVPREVLLALTHRCYVLPAGASTKLRITFHEGKEAARPKGTLVIEPKRGKVKPSRVKLDGSKDAVVVEYKAPDETIRVSVRAFLEGFARGKAHLHLE